MWSDGSWQTALEGTTETSQVSWFDGGMKVSWCVCVLFCFCVTIVCMAYPSNVCCWCQPRLDHIAYDHAKAHNPLRLACYSDEDAVGQIKRLAAKAYPKQLSQQVLLRYAAYCCVRWLRQLTEWYMWWLVTCDSGPTCMKTTLHVVTQKQQHISRQSGQQHFPVLHEKSWCPRRRGRFAQSWWGEITWSKLNHITSIEFIWSPHVFGWYIPAPLRGVKKAPLK